MVSISVKTGRSNWPLECAAENTQNKQCFLKTIHSF